MSSRLLLEYETVKIQYLRALKDNSGAYQIVSEFMTDVLSEPAKDFSGMLLNPFKEELSDAMAPLKSAMQPIMENINSVIQSILKPLIGILLNVLEAAGPVIQDISRLFGWTPSEGAAT